MKKLFPFLVTVLVAAAGFGAEPVDVTVSNASGKAIFKGKTNASGTFATGKVQPGDYVVQLHSNAPLKGDGYAVVISAGKKKMSADSLPGSKFAGGGIAMKIAVGDGMNITGQVVAGGASGGDPNVKVVNGTKYYWVKGGTGSNLGGRWMTAEEAKSQGFNVHAMSSDSVRRMQEGPDPHQEGFTGR